MAALFGGTEGEYYWSGNVLQNLREVLWLTLQTIQTQLDKVSPLD
jgi:hypothetical protein